MTTQTTESAEQAQAAEPTALEAAMWRALGELSPDEEARVRTASQEGGPDGAAAVWRDLIAERAAAEREASLREELEQREETAQRERTQALASQPRPTAGLSGGAPPPAAPESVAGWTSAILAAAGEAERTRLRSAFASWLARHPEA